MKKGFIAIIFGVLLLLGACGSDTDDAVNDVDTTDAAEGTDKVEESNEDTEEAAETVATVEELYKENCASCHSGDYELAANESEQSIKELEGLILNGIGNMPAIDVTEEEATLIAQYLAKE